MAGGVALGLVASRFLKASSSRRYESRYQSRYESSGYLPARTGDTYTRSGLGATSPATSGLGTSGAGLGTAGATSDLGSVGTRGTSDLGARDLDVGATPPPVRREPGFDDPALGRRRGGRLADAVACCPRGVTPRGAADPWPCRTPTAGPARGRRRPPRRHPWTDPRERPIGELVKDLASQTSTLVRQEIQLAQAELTQKGKIAGKGAGMLAGAAVVGLLALGALTAMLIALLSEFMDDVARGADHHRALGRRGRSSWRAPAGMRSSGPPHRPPRPSKP